MTAVKKKPTVYWGYESPKGVIVHDALFSSKKTAMEWSGDFCGYNVVQVTISKYKPKK